MFQVDKTENLHTGMITNTETWVEQMEDNENLSANHGVTYFWPIV